MIEVEKSSELAVVIPTNKQTASRLKWELQHERSWKGRVLLTDEQRKYKTAQVEAYQHKRKGFRQGLQIIAKKVVELPEKVAREVVFAFAAPNLERGLTPDQQIEADKLKIHFLQNRLKAARALKKKVAEIVKAAKKKDNSKPKAKKKAEASADPKRQKKPK